MSLGKGFLLLVLIGAGFLLLSPPKVDVQSLANEQSSPSDSHVSPAKTVGATAPTVIDTNLSEPSTSNSRPITAIDRIKAITEKNEFQQALVSEHEQHKRYLPQNQILESESQDPITQRYAIDERTTVNEEKTVEMTVWAEQKYYLKDDTVRFFAKVTDAQGQSLQDNLTAQFSFGAHLLINIPMVLAPQGQNGVYEGSLSLAQQNISEPGIYKIMIQSPSHKIEDGITFTLSKPDIELTNEFKDNINGNKDLEIAVQINASIKNRYYIQGSLYGVDGSAIATSQEAIDLEPGTHWVTLIYSGNLFKDANQAGPYHLKKVSLAKVTMPMQRTPLIETSYQTDSYSIAEFSQ